MQYKNSPASKKQSVLFLIGLIPFLMHLTACNNKQARYFQGNLDTNRIKNVEVKETIIQKNDILNEMLIIQNPNITSKFLCTLKN